MGLNPDLYLQTFPENLLEKCLDCLVIPMVRGQGFEPWNPYGIGS